MLRMDQVHVVRHKVLVEKKSQREVAAELNISRNTVRRYLRQSEPRRAEGEPRARPAYDRVKARMAAILEEWAHRTTAKQRITGTRLWEQLRTEGYRVGITLVRQHLWERRRATAEVFIPLVYHPGDVAQVDFFEVTVDIGSVRQTAWMLVIRLMHSRRDFAWIYTNCDQVSFLDGHVRAFAHFGAVPHRCVYDNLSAAVKKALPKRELTPRFAALVSHYLFEPCFARVGTGHDKGGVEGRGRGIRLQDLTPIPTADTLPAINAALLVRLDERFDAERFAADQKAMLPVNNAPFEPAETVAVEVRSNATVRLAKALYSVPSTWARRTATAYVGPVDIRLVCGDEQIVRPRQNRGGRLIKYRDYLPELSRKPQALRQVAAELLVELGEPYGAFWRLLVDAHGPHDAARVFAKVLGAVSVKGDDAVTTALAPLIMQEPAIIERPLPPPTHVPVPDALLQHHVESARAEDYDALLLEVSDD